MVGRCAATAVVVLVLATRGAWADEPFKLQLVPIADGVIGSHGLEGASEIGESEIAQLALRSGVDLENPEHPLVAYSVQDDHLFYVFYKRTLDAFGDRPYLIQRIRKTTRTWASKDATPKEEVDYLVEVFKTNGGAIKGADQHFARYGLGEDYKHEVVKEYEIGFGELPGVASGKEWPFDKSKAYVMVQEYGPAHDRYDRVRFDRMRKWSLTVSFDEDDNYVICSPEFGINLRRELPALEDVAPEMDTSEGRLILLEGRGVRGLLVGKSTAKDVAKKFGEPLEVVRVSGGAQNHSYAGGVTFNIYDGKAINTIFTRPDFAGNTSRGIRHGDSREKVKRVYGKPTSDEDDEKYWSYRSKGVAFWFDAQGKVSKIVISERRRERK